MAYFFGSALGYLLDPIPWGIAILLYFVFKNRPVLYWLISSVVMVGVSVGLSMAATNSIPPYLIPIKIINSAIIVGIILMIASAIRKK